MLVTVGRYFDPWEAYILQARLVAEGIPASVAGDQLITANWPMSVALGGATLQVPETCVEQAVALIADYHAGVLEQELASEDPSTVDTCPACDSTRLASTVPLGQRVLAIAAYVVASAPFPTSASQMSCLSCGHHWRYGS